jgi:hypothetical protein
LKILDILMDKTDKIALRDLIITSKMKALLVVGVNNFKISIRLYDELITQAKRIMEEIDKETGD